MYALAAHSVRTPPQYPHVYPLQCSFDAPTSFAIVCVCASFARQSPFLSSLPTVRRYVDGSTVQAIFGCSCLHIPRRMFAHSQRRLVALAGVELATHPRFQFERLPKMCLPLRYSAKNCIMAGSMRWRICPRPSASPYPQHHAGTGFVFSTAANISMLVDSSIILISSSVVIDSP